MPGTRSVNATTPMYPHSRWVMVIAVVCLGVMMMSGAGRAAGDEYTAKYWKGKYINQATQQLGNPTEMRVLMQTARTMYIFANPNKPHWVFETEPGGKIVKATRIQ